MLTPRFVVLGLAALGLLISGSARAGDYYTDAAIGDDTPGCGTDLSPCQSIGYTISQFSPDPSLGDPAVVHVGPGLYAENAVVNVGFSLPNHTHLISDHGADETILMFGSVDNLDLTGLIFVVRSESIGFSGQNATDIWVDGFTLTVPNGEVDLERYQVGGIDMGGGTVTEIAPEGIRIVDNFIAVRNRTGRTNTNREGLGISVAGGAEIDCNVLAGIDSVGISSGSVYPDSGGVNDTQPTSITRNWLHRFTDSPATEPDISTDLYFAVGIDVDTTIRGNLLDFRRSATRDSSWAIVCWDCSMTVENNIIAGVGPTDGAGISLISLGQYAATPFTPTIRHNTIAPGTSGIASFLQFVNEPPTPDSEENFLVTVENNILWATNPVSGPDPISGAFDYNNSQGSTDPLSGTGNISDDPLFVSTTDPDLDLRLQAGSPSLTAGNGGAQQGAYGGTTPFGAVANPLRPCTLRETAPSFPDTSVCPDLPPGTPCGTRTCQGLLLQGSSCFGGACFASIAAVQDCDDQDPCTDDSCDPTTGCANVPNGSCSDGGPTDGGDDGADGGDGGPDGGDAAGPGDPAIAGDDSPGDPALADGVPTDGGPTSDGTVVRTDDDATAGRGLGMVRGGCGCSQRGDARLALSFLFLAGLLAQRRRRRG